MTDAAIALAAGAARLSVARRGAEAIAWIVGDVELLWPGDPAIWGEISPILYPVVGWTRDGARVGGRHYPLGLHGFASGENFAVETADAAFARLALRDNAKTRALYPFAFALAVEYRLAGAALEITLEVANPGDAPAPYACGHHPGLADICLVPQIFNARRLKVPLDRFSKITAVEAACLKLPAFDKARPENQPDAE